MQSLGINPLSPPAAPVQGRLQGPPAKSKFLAVNALPKAPSAYYELGYKTIADVDGRFEFNNVADGFYFCTTSVRWLVNENRYAGGSIMKFVDVRGGKTVTIVVSGR